MHFRQLVAVTVGTSLLAAAGILSVAAPAEALTTHTVASPDGSTSLSVRNEDDGSLTYSVLQGGQSVIDSSKLGIVTAATDLSTGLSFDGESDRQVNQSYSLVESFNGPVTSSANEMTLTYHRGAAQVQVVVRAQNDGVAFQYKVSGVGTTSITREATTFKLPSGTGLWASDYRDAKDYEERYPYVSSSSMGTRHFAMPTLGSLRNNAAWLLISEAGVYDNDGLYPAVRLDAQGDNNTELKTQLPGPDTNVFSTVSSDVAVPTGGTFNTPWRVIVTSSSLDTLTNTHLITDLNPAPASGTDTSWIKPGKATWSWWSNEEKASDGDNMVLSQKSYVDSAEELGMQYVTVDCCYNDSNGDVETIAAYGKKHGIGVFIWKNKGDFTNSDGSYFTQTQLDSALQTIVDRGVAGIKIDFMQSDRADTMALYQRIAAAGLKAHLLVNFHGSTKPSGENRTYPNIITSEAILGSEQYKYDRAPTAADDATYPFTRNVVGGMDMTPVVFSIDSLNTTQAHQLALSVVFSSAMQHFADSNAAYETWVGRHFLRAVPTVWDQSKVVEGFPGNYATIARRSGNDWYLGAIADGARTTSIPLNFLGSGSYTATIFRDGSSDRQITKETRTVTASDTLAIPLRTHGGMAVQISKNPLPILGTSDTVLEAEASGNTLTGGASSASCAGCSSGTKIGNLTNGASVRFNTVPGGNGGAKILRVGYLSADPRSFTLAVNGGAPVTVAPPRSGNASGGTPDGFGIVRDVDVPVTLNAGNNTVTIAAAPGGFAPDIDRIILESSYEAEASSVTRTGNAAVTACNGSECSGSKVGSITGASTLTFTNVNASTAGSTTLQIRYAATSARSALLSVNGGPTRTVTFPATASSDDVSTKTVYVDLQAGTNTVRLDAGGGTAPDIDRLLVRQ
ncbi:glycoside hydrolase family 97 catalytic domain-containing protein [Curtobacterium sp. L1-20]|uniref:glycoside hydrolase family 97 catalytic domain-containing protein n=1 Tax=Curtobacterium sp. L1-20 TaxID=3138181 RepID=UPI003B52EAD1